MHRNPHLKPTVSVEITLTVSLLPVREQAQSERPNIAVFYIADFQMSFYLLRNIHCSFQLATQAQTGFDAGLIGGIGSDDHMAHPKALENGSAKQTSLGCVAMPTVGWIHMVPNMSQIKLFGAIPNAQGYFSRHLAAMQRRDVKNKGVFCVDPLAVTIVVLG